jgi:hypothetical protein
VIVAELTGLFGVDWATVFLIALGLCMAVMSLRRDVPGLRIGPVLVIPLVSGVLLAATIVLMRSSDISRFSPFITRPVTTAFVFAAVFAAAAIVDVLLTRLAPLPRLLWRARSPALMANVGLAVFVSGVAVASAGAMYRITGVASVEPPPLGLRARMTIEATYALPSAPLDVELLDEVTGYVSLGPRIARFELPARAGDALELTTVAEGFTYTRGLAIVDDTLVVADLGPLPCPDPYPICKGHDVPDVDLIEGERRILETSRGQLVAFDIGPDGTLTGRRVILDRLPVANTEHGLNDVEVGADGRIYVSIGNLDHLPADEAASVRRPNEELLGTVVAVSPDGGDLEVLARGLRNVYGLAFDQDGELWGVDNDGEALNGWRAEELLQIKPGRHYGYPREGSFGALTVRDDFAVWHVEGVGSAGVLWAGDVGLGPGVLVGSFGHISGISLTRLGGEWAVYDRSSASTLVELPGFVSGLEALGSDRVLATVIATDALYVLSVES